MEVLRAQGRSQIWLSKQISRSYVVTTNYCNNKTQPSLSILNKIAFVLAIDIKDLLVSTKDTVMQEETINQQTSVAQLPKQVTAQNG
jgi:putative transcriptional regulator